jgi:hypothetical protein
MNQIQDKKLVAFCGYCRAGKNSFGDILQETLKDSAPNLKVEQFSFANALRQELFHFINENFNIDAFTEDEEEKKIIRPILIAYGNAKRAQSKNQYWIQKIHKKIEKSDCDVAIITDLRFAETEDDELGWFQSQRGKLFHIKRYVQKGKIRVLQPAPNEFEKANDPKLEAAAYKKYKIPMVQEKDEFFKIVKDECENLIGLFL